MTENRKQDLLKGIPAVGKLLEHEEVSSWLRVAPRSAVVDSLRFAVDATRDAVLADRDVSIDPETVVGIAEQHLTESMLPSLMKVINATGIVLHTGLGRAPLCAEAIEAIAECAGGYCNLEFDLADGERGRRTSHVTGLLCRITGAEGATVVNNNAAATLLILRVLCEGREVLVSRGQLVEIGGSFRLPDILSASGAVLREVGTTNRTRLSDYADAVNERTAAILRVHHSNYRIVGFSEEASLEELIGLARRRGLLMIDDVGSGALIPTPLWPSGREPVVSQSIRAGADLVCCSGDKLMGGPQCGILVGRKDLIELLDKHPLMRTYRLDKLTLLALEATLRHWVDADHAVGHIPTLAMLAATPASLLKQAEELQKRLAAAMPDETFLVCSGTSFAGGGSLPGDELESVVIAWRPLGMSASEAARRLRRPPTPVITRVHDDSLHFDLRTISPQDFDDLVETLAGAATEEEPGLPVLQGKMIAKL